MFQNTIDDLVEFSHVVPLNPNGTLSREYITREAVLVTRPIIAEKSKLEPPINFPYYEIRRAVKKRYKDFAQKELKNYYPDASLTQVWRGQEPSVKGEYINKVTSHAIMLVMFELSFHFKTDKTMH